MKKTEVWKIADPHAPEGQAMLNRAAAVLRQGGLVVFPTETVYGLGGDATDATAAERIYAAKGRPSDNPLIVHIAYPEEAAQYAATSELYDRLAQAFLPGPLTVIMPAKATIPRTVTGGLPTVAIRCPSHPVAHALLRATGRPIAAPSANLSGSPSPTCARHVIEDMDGRVDMILDGGDCEIGVESTIVKIEPDGSLTLLRPGGITPDMLQAVCSCIHIAEAVLGELPKGSVALSPGMKYRHYAPHTPLVLLDGSPEGCAAYIQKNGGHCAVLCYAEDAPFFSYIPAGQLFAFGERAAVAQQAHCLFTLLRDVDKLGMEKIYAPLPVPHGMGMALYNRMIRAAAHQIIRVNAKGDSENG